MTKKVELAINATVPDFTLNDQNGDAVSLSSLHGKKVVLYFYPRDNTPGCTTEACDFRDSKADYDRAKAIIVGVSPDEAASHQKFISKFDLPFTLLCDPNHEAAKLFGVYKKKNMYGKQVMGIERSTFLIDSTGKLRHEIRKVKVDGHVAEVLELLKAMK